MDEIRGRGGPSTGPPAPTLPDRFLTGEATWAERRPPRRPLPRRIESPTTRRALVATGFVIAVCAQVLAQTAAAPPWLAIAGLLPLALAIDPSSRRRSWLVLGPFAAALTALTCLWVGLYGPDYDSLIPPLSAYAAVVLGLPAALACRAAATPRAPATGLLALPAGWMLGEVLARRCLLGVSWALLGLPLAEWTWLAPAVAVAGPEALSGLALAVAVALALPIRRAPAWAIAAGAIQGPALLLAAWLWSSFATPPPAAAPLFRVALIQPNFPQGETWTPELRERRLAFLDRLVDETRFGSPGLIVLPEAAVNGFVRYDDALTEWVKSVVTRTGRPLVFGSLDRAESGAGPSNAAILISPDGRVETYRKNRLVPVSESLPEVGPLHSWLVNLRGGVEEFAPGAEPSVFVLAGGVRFATPICYEDVLPDLGRAFALAGARVLISLSNTQRFNGTSQPDLHLRRARLVAAAVGLPMLRCTNSGVTCQVATDGRVVGRLTDGRGLDRDFAAAAVLAVPLRSIPTVYRRFGDRVPLACGAGLIAVYAGIARVARRRGPAPAEVA